MLFYSILTQQIVFNSNSFLAVSCILGITVGTLGYLAFGNDQGDNIFDNFKADKISIGLRVFFSFSLTSSILLYSFPIGKSLDQLTKLYILKDQSENMNFIIKGSIRALLFLSYSLISFFIQDLNSYFDLLGCVFCTILTFVAPQLFLRKASLKNQIYQTTILSDRKIQDIPSDQVMQDTPCDKTVQDISGICQLPSGRIIYALCLFVLVYGLIGGISGTYSVLMEL